MRGEEGGGLHAATRDALHQSRDTEDGDGRRLSSCPLCSFARRISVKGVRGWRGGEGEEDLATNSASVAAGLCAHCAL